MRDYVLRSCSAFAIAVLFASGCAPAEYSRLADLGLTGGAGDWRSVSWGAGGKTVGDAELIAAAPDLKRIRVRALHLATMPVTDRAMPYIAQMTSLETLDLSGTRVTREGLREVARLPRLKYLWVSLRAYSPEAIESLAKALPGTKIDNGMAEGSEAAGGDSRTGPR